METAPIELERLTRLAQRVPSAVMDAFLDLSNCICPERARDLFEYSKEGLAEKVDIGSEGPYTSPILEFFGSHRLAYTRSYSGLETIHITTLWRDKGVLTFEISKYGGTYRIERQPSQKNPK